MKSAADRDIKMSEFEAIFASAEDDTFDDESAFELFKLGFYPYRDEERMNYTVEVHI